MLVSRQHTIRSCPLLGPVHSTNFINLPVRPPIPPNALVTPEPTRDRVEPAELETLLKPSEALDTEVDAVSFALEAVSAAVEACLILLRRRRNRD
jgi:hypothetical protein